MELLICVVGFFAVWFALWALGNHARKKLAQRRAAARRRARRER